MVAGAYVDATLSDEQVREAHAALQAQGTWDEAPASARPKPSSSKPTTGTVTKTLTSTKDPNQNVTPLSEQIKRREIHAAATLKRQEQNLARADDLDFHEMIDIVKATHQSELDIIN